MRADRRNRRRKWKSSDGQLPGRVQGNGSGDQVPAILAGTDELYDSGTETVRLLSGTAVYACGVEEGYGEGGGEMVQGHMYGLVNAQSTTGISYAKRLRYDAKLLANTQPTSLSLNIQPPKHPIQLLRLAIPLHLSLPFSARRCTRPNPTRTIQQPLLLRPPRLLLLHILRLKDMHSTIQPAGRNAPLLSKFLPLSLNFPLFQRPARIVLEFLQVILKRCATA